MYIVEVDSQDRELQAIQHLLSLSLIYEQILSRLGFGSLTWILVQALNSRLTPGVEGDIDILMGELGLRDPESLRAEYNQIAAENPLWPRNSVEEFAARSVVQNGGIEWPPAPSKLGGLEVKCAYYTDKIRSAKSSQKKIDKLRMQVDRLREIGLDAYGLLDIVGTDPSYEESGGFSGALQRADAAKTAANPILRQRLPDGSPAGHYFWSVGSVGGGDESMRGAACLLEFKAPRGNPSLEANDPETLQHRAARVENLRETFRRLPPPTCFPAVFIDCRSCGSIHYMSHDHSVPSETHTSS